MCRESSIVSWREGHVCRAGEHFVLTYGPVLRATLWVALIGPPNDGIVDVEFLIDRADAQHREAVTSVEREIDFYLIDKGEPDAWQYAQYHCTTSANMYSRVHWGFFMSKLDHHVEGFIDDLARFPGFERLSFTVSELQADSDWPWGYAHGVYCFTVNGDVVYVGRALGCTLGDRLADQLRSISDPEWESVVTGSTSRIEVFAVDKEWAFLGAALEAYLIGHLSPQFNKRVS